MAPYKYAPSKKVYRKKYKKRYQKRKDPKSKKTFASNNIVSYISRMQLPFPPRYRCKLTTAFYGYIATGASAANNWSAKLNSAYLPFNGGGWTNSAPAIATNVPTGYPSLLNTLLYQSARVYSSRITVEFLPQNLLDTIICTITPSDGNVVPSSVALALEQPYTKQLMMSSSKMNSKNGSALSNSISQHKFVGVRHQAIEDDLSGEYIQQWDSDPARLMFWVVNTVAPDGAVLTAPLEYRVKITHYLECFNFTSSALP